MTATHFNAPIPANEHSTFATPPQAPAPKEPKRAWWKKPLVFVGAGALVLGILIGGSGKPAPVTVEKIVEKPVEKRVEVKVPVAPAACLTYIDLSETAFGYASEALGYTTDALKAAGSFDTASINAASASLKVLNPKISAIAPKVSASKAECRAAK